MKKFNLRLQAKNHDREDLFNAIETLLNICDVPLCDVETEVKAAEEVLDGFDLLNKIKFEAKSI